MYTIFWSLLQYGTLHSCDITKNRGYIRPNNFNVLTASIVLHKDTDLAGCGVVIALVNLTGGDGYLDS